MPRKMTEEEFNALPPEKQKQILDNRRRNQKYADSEKGKEKKAKYYQNNKDYFEERNRNYRENNQDEILSYRKKYYEENKDYVINKSKQYYEENKDDRLGYVKDWAKNNKEKVLKYSKKHRDNNKEKASEYYKKYREENIEKILQRQLNYRINNKEKLIDIHARYRKSNKGIMNSRRGAQKRLHVKKQVDANIINVAQIKFIYSKFSHQCFNCGSDNTLCLDHHYPLSKGYPLIEQNTVILCNSCNTSKGNKLPQNFYTEAKLKQLETFFDIATREEMDQYRKVI
jgi:5-methylcytosine-specific restriction endonuclease McrA